MLTTDCTKRSHFLRSIIGPGLLAGGLAISVAANTLADTPDAQASEAAMPTESVSAEQQAAEQRVEAIFADSADMAVLGSDRCLPSRRIRGVDVLDNQTVVFDMGRKDNYLVRFKRQCFGLRRDSAISYEIHGGRLCRLDGIRSLEHWGINRLVPGPRCSIPAFIKVSEAELELVEAKVDAARAARIAQRDAQKAARRAAKEAREQSKEQASSQTEDSLVGG